MRTYTASAETTSVSAAKTLILLECPANMSLIIHSAEVVAPDDDTNEQLHFTLQRLATYATPTGTANTPAPHSQGDPASSVVSIVDVTASEPTYDASTEIGQAGASSLGGWRFDPTIEERPEVPPTEGFGLRLITAPGSAKTLTVRITFSEVG